MLLPWVESSTERLYQRRAGARKAVVVGSELVAWRAQPCPSSFTASSMHNVASLLNLLGHCFLPNITTAKSMHHVHCAKCTSVQHDSLFKYPP
jgi:hypothetical protein